MAQVKSKQKWPNNSELYMTLREIKREMPKPDLSNLSLSNSKITIIRIPKPVKPNGEHPGKK